MQVQVEVVACWELPATAGNCWQLFVQRWPARNSVCKQLCTMATKLCQQPLLCNGLVLVRKVGGAMRVKKCAAVVVWAMVI